MGKGSKRRPSQISAEEEQLRWELAFQCESPKRKREVLSMLGDIEFAKELENTHMDEKHNHLNEELE